MGLSLIISLRLLYSRNIASNTFWPLYSCNTAFKCLDKVFKLTLHYCSLLLQASKRVYKISLLPNFMSESLDRPNVRVGTALIILIIFRFSMFEPFESQELNYSFCDDYAQLSYGEYA
jgi:hypothetical protein